MTGRFAKILMTLLWGMTVVCMIVIVSAGIRIRHNARASAAMPRLFDCPGFNLLDQDGKPVRSADLHGEPWISEFIFTHCTSICPAMLAKMAELQKTLDPRIGLVSFSVDPETDRPEVLKEKADALHADPARWRFLTTRTGDQDGVRNVQQGMMLVRAGEEMTPAMHDNRFFLFDAGGHCVGIYTSSDTDQINKLKSDAASLLSGDNP